MSRLAFRSLTTALTLACALGTAQAAAINQISYGDVSGVGTIGFDSVPGGPVLDGVVQIGAAKFGEHFKGQSVGTSGLFDTLSGAPVGPLNLLSGGVDKNLYLTQGGLAGLGAAGRLGDPCLDPDDPDCVPPVLSDDAIGEGAISILFDGDQSEFGFELLGANQGLLHLAFFRIDGSLIERLDPIRLDLGLQTFGFRRSGGVKDIAGISIWNEDEGGLTFDGLKFDVITVRQPPGGGTVPLPSALLLAGLALGAALGLRRR